MSNNNNNNNNNKNNVWIPIDSNTASIVLHDVWKRTKSALEDATEVDNDIRRQKMKMLTMTTKMMIAEKTTETKETKTSDTKMDNNGIKLAVEESTTDVVEIPIISSLLLSSSSSSSSSSSDDSDDDDDDDDDEDSKEGDGNAENQTLKKSVLKEVENDDDSDNDNDNDNKISSSKQNHPPNKSYGKHSKKKHGKKGDNNTTVHTQRPPTTLIHIPMIASSPEPTLSSSSSSSSSVSLSVIPPQIGVVEVPTCLFIRNDNDNDDDDDDDDNTNDDYYAQKNSDAKKCTTGGGYSENYHRRNLARLRTTFRILSELSSLSCHLTSSSLPSMNSLPNGTATASPNRTYYTGIILMRSGRFAAVLYCHNKTSTPTKNRHNKDNMNNNSHRKIAHHVSHTRYTSRKGQGGSQSCHDSKSGNAKSIGSQMRRAGEVQLKEDVRKCMTEWWRIISASASENNGNGKSGELKRMYIGVSKMLLGSFWNDVTTVIQKNRNGGSKKVGGSSSSSSNNNSDILPSSFHDTRVSVINVGYGRPSYEMCLGIYENLVSIRFLPPPSPQSRRSNDTNETSQTKNGKNQTKKDDNTIEVAAKKKIDDKDNTPKMDAFITIPYTDLHIAARDGNLNSLRSFVTSLSNNNKIGDDTNENDEHCNTMDDDDGDNNNIVNIRAGKELRTPLHLAVLYAVSTQSSSSSSSSSSSTPLLISSPSVECIKILLVELKADPTILDIDGRLAFHLASSSSSILSSSSSSSPSQQLQQLSNNNATTKIIRMIFRIARAQIGENVPWERTTMEKNEEKRITVGWDSIGVGPPIHDEVEDLRRKKEKIAEKRRRKRLKQKEEKNAMKLRDALLAKEKEEKDAKGKTGGGGTYNKSSSSSTNTTQKLCCETCDTHVKRSQLYERLGYIYCSTQCVSSHKRELAAMAAIARMGKS